MAAIKTDLKSMILAVKPKVDSESIQALDIGDVVEYERKLRAELSQSSQSSVLCRRQEPAADLLDTDCRSPTVLGGGGVEGWVVLFVFMFYSCIFIHFHFEGSFY